jgi:hypothetical protein
MNLSNRLGLSQKIEKGSRWSLIGKICITFGSGCSSIDSVDDKTQLFVVDWESAKLIVVPVARNRLILMSSNERWCRLIR